MSAAHSPTPWSVENKGQGGESDDVLLDAAGRTIALIGDFISDIHDPIGPTRRKANVALLLGAPDLLALAHEFADSCCECGGDRCQDCEDIWAVIDKAEGRS